jgi:hypothetical protein
VEPLGLRMHTGLVVGRTLVNGSEVVKKWAVAPVSAHASVQCCTFMLVGAPDGDDARTEEVSQ